MPSPYRPPYLPAVEPENRSPLSAEGSVHGIVLVHVLASLCLAVFSVARMWPAVAALGCLLFAQANLIGLWAAVGRSDPRVRIMGVLADYVFNVFALLMIVGPLHQLVIVIPIMPVLFMYAICAASRLTPWRLRWLNYSTQHSVCPKPQFLIRHIMVATAVIGIILALLRVAGSLLQSDFMVIVAVTVMMTIGAIIAIWAALADRHRSRIPLGFVLGFLPGLLAGFFSVEFADLVLFSLISAIQTAIVLITLLLVRSAGYRLAIEGGLNSAPTNAADSDL